MSLRNINLNLLPILRVLLREVSVSRAAAELCMSQPAISSALNRLRALIGDPLLIRVGRGMRLSPKARELLPLLDEACMHLDALLNEVRFYPPKTRRTFVIEAADYMELLLGGPLFDTLSEVAPFAAVNFIHANGAYRDQLQSGAADLAIIPWDQNLVHGFSQMHGYSDRMVGVVRMEHPFASQAPQTAAEFNAYPHAGAEVRYRKVAANTAIDRALQVLRGHQRLGTESFILLPVLASQTDCVAIVPKTLADQVQKVMPITSFELPGEPIVLDYAVLWSPINNADPAHRWFRGLVTGLMREHFKPDSPRLARGPQVAASP